MAQSKSETELLSEISHKLDLILGYLATRGIEGDTAEIVERLNRLGASSKVIAPIAGLSENAVNIRLTRLKKKKPAKKRGNQ